MRNFRGTLVQRYELVIEQQRTYQKQHRKHDWYLIEGEFSEETSLSDAILLPKELPDQYRHNIPTTNNNLLSLSDLIKQYCERYDNDKLIKLWVKAIHLKSVDAFHQLIASDILKSMFDELLAQHSYIQSHPKSPTNVLYSGNAPSVKRDETVYKTHPAYVVGTIIKNENEHYVFSSILEMAIARSKHLTQQIFYVPRTLSELDLGIETITLIHHVLDDPEKYDDMQIRLYGYLIRQLENNKDEYYVTPAMEFVSAKGWESYTIWLDNEEGLIGQLYGTHTVTWGSAESYKILENTMTAKQRNYEPPASFPVSYVQIVGTIAYNPDKLPSVKMTDIHIVANPANNKSYYVVSSS